MVFVLIYLFVHFLYMLRVGPKFAFYMISINFLCLISFLSTIPDFSVLTVFLGTFFLFFQMCVVFANEKLTGGLWWVSNTQEAEILNWSDVIKIIDSISIPRNNDTVIINGRRYIRTYY